MNYKLAHRTAYRYKYPVSLATHIACLTPRSVPRQTCLGFELAITPSPSNRSERIDYFGNRLTLFTVSEPHNELVVTATSNIAVSREPWTQRSNPVLWEEVRTLVSADRSAEGLQAYEFAFDSPRVRSGPSFASYAAQSFTRGRSFSEALLDLTARIHHEFKFDVNATTVRTTPEDVIKKKRGVCQDFSHVQIACLRSLGIPARYVSGYLRTHPPPGKPRLIGCDVSHAWVSAYCPGFGWLDVDPTNNVVPSDGHVVLAWGRDYGDISPLRGMILGGNDHALKVSVDLEPVVAS